jgi:hypothetical protein
MKLTIHHMLLALWTKGFADSMTLKATSGEMGRRAFEMPVSASEMRTAWLDLPSAM